MYATKKACNTLQKTKEYIIVSHHQLQEESMSDDESSTGSVEENVAEEEVEAITDLSNS